MRKHSGRLPLNMDKKYWCLFCGEDEIRFDTTEELFTHMKTTVHRDKKGGLIIPTGKINEN